MDSIASVSFATTQKAAYLDGALALSVMLEENRSLTLGTAQNSVKGLVDAIRASPSNYASLLSSISTAYDQATVSNARLTKPAWTSASGAVENTVAGTVNTGFGSLVSEVRNDANAALTAANDAQAGTANKTTESTLATVVVTSTQLLLTALTQLDNNRDAAALTNLATARADTTQALTDAQALLTTLQRGNNPDQARITATQAVIDSAQTTLAAIARAETTAVTPLALAAGENPSTVKLSADTDPVTYLSTWGSSGAVALTDANGQGIVIAPDGRVDTVPPSGDGWQFQKDSTFLLSDGTKVSYTPGNPASLLATRGEQVVTITGLAPGQTPVTTLDKTGGVAADAARNDGYIFTMGADARAWSLAGAPLGDTAGSREVVATTPLTNEYLGADVTDVAVATSLTQSLTDLGIDWRQYDTNNNGSLSSKEWPALLAALEEALLLAQTAFDASIANTKLAVEALISLNQFLEQAILAVDQKADAKSVSGAAERDQLVRIQRDLNAGLKALQTPAAPAPTTGNVLGDARTVLAEIDSFGADAPPPSRPANPNEPAATAEGARSESSLRLAGRLLSGFAGGAPAPRFLPPLGPAPGTPAEPTAPATSPAPTDGVAAPLSAESAPTSGNANPAPPPAANAPTPAAAAAGSPAPDAPLTANAPTAPADTAAAPPPPPAAPLDPAVKVATGWSKAVQAGWKKLQENSTEASLDAMLAAILQSPATASITGLSTTNPAAPVQEAPPTTPVGARNQALLRAVIQVLVAGGNESPDAVPTAPAAPARAEPNTPPASPAATAPAAPSTAPDPAAPRLSGPDAALVRAVAGLLASAPNESTPPATTPTPALPAAPDEALLRAIRGALTSARNEPSPASTATTAASATPPAATPRLSRRDEAVLRAITSVLTLARNEPPANGGQPILPGSSFPATGPDPLVSPDPTFGASDGSYRETGRRIDQYRGVHQDQLKVAQQLQTQVRQVVQQFLGIVAQDDQLRQVFSADDLSDDKRTEFKGKMENLEKDLGISWGGDSEKTPAGQTNINLKALLSGMRL